MSRNDGNNRGAFEVEGGGGRAIFDFVRRRDVGWRCDLGENWTMEAVRTDSGVVEAREEGL